MFCILLLAWEGQTSAKHELLVAYRTHTSRPARRGAPAETGTPSPQGLLGHMHHFRTPALFP